MWLSRIVPCGLWYAHSSQQKQTKNRPALSKEGAREIIKWPKSTVQTLLCPQWETQLDYIKLRFLAHLLVLKHVEGELYQLLCDCLENGVYYGLFSACDTLKMFKFNVTICCFTSSRNRYMQCYHSNGHTSKHSFDNKWWNDLVKPKRKIYCIVCTIHTEQVICPIPLVVTV